jgi:plastocyanin
MHMVRGRHGLIVAALVACGVLSLALGFGARAVQAQGAQPVSIVYFAFQPAAIQVATGATVTWSNMDGAPHTVTSDSGAFDSGMLGTGATFSQTFSAPGAYAYFCQFHPSMTATIVVS